MTLIQKLQESVEEGYCVSFSKNGLTNSLCIIITKWSKLKYYNRESELPLHDHFYESKIVDCITWMEDEIKKRINGVNV